MTDAIDVGAVDLDRNGRRELARQLRAVAALDAPSGLDRALRRDLLDAADELAAVGT